LGAVLLPSFVNGEVKILIEHNTLACSLLSKNYAAGDIDNRLALASDEK